MSVSPGKEIFDVLAELRISIQACSLHDKVEKLGKGGLNGWEGAKGVDPPIATARGYGGAL